MKPGKAGMLGEAICTVEPFKYILFPEVNLSREQSNSVLDWLDNRAPWCRRTTSFYDQYELVLRPDDVDTGISFLVSGFVLEDLHSRLEELFEVELYDFVRISTHKLVSGQNTGIHTDQPGGHSATHRLLIQFNRKWEDTYGGHLVLLSGPTVQDVHRILRPINKFGFAFECGEKSFHCVVKVKDGNRYTFVYEFWRKPLEHDLQHVEVIKENNKGMFDIQ